MKEIIDAIKKDGEKFDVKKEPDTLVVFLLDRSGSMSGQAPSVIEGYNEYLQGLREGDDVVHLSLILFDDQYEVVYDAVPAGDVEDLSDSVYFARGMTALLQSVGRAITATEAKIKTYTEKPTVLMVIFTDGLNNMPSEHDVTKLISERSGEDTDWTFTYIGSHADSWKAAKSMGIPAGNAAYHTMSNPVGTYQALSAATRGLRGKKMRAASGQSVSSVDLMAGLEREELTSGGVVTRMSYDEPVQDPNVKEPGDVSLAHAIDYAQNDKAKKVWVEPKNEEEK